MIFEGTENMPRYPWMKGSDLMGFVSYGAKKMPDGSRAYKAIYVQQNKTEG